MPLAAGLGFPLALLFAVWLWLLHSELSNVKELLTEAISTTFILKILNLQFKQLFFILEIAKGNSLMIKKKEKKKQAWALCDEILSLFKRMANSMV